MGIAESVLARRQTPGWRRIVRRLLVLQGVDIPVTVRTGKNFRLLHGGFGTVLSYMLEIGDDVTICHGVSVGHGDACVISDESQTLRERIIIDDGAWLMPGSVVLAGPGITRVGKNTVIGANAVLTCSTGDNEIWYGIPARKVADRSPVSASELHRVTQPQPAQSEHATAG